MIISFSRNYIFLKPFKVAGTSVLQALGSTCSEGDQVSAVFLRPPELERFPSGHLERIPMHILPGEPPTLRYRINTSLHTHALPSEVRAAAGGDRWERFLKISIVRNPWDLMLSFRRMRLMNPEGFHKTAEEDFPEFVSRFRFENLPHPYHQTPVNDVWYFDPDTGEPIPDVFIRYENLQEDFDGLSDRLGMDRQVLPHLQNKGSRPPYQTFYTPAMRDRVGELFARTIDYFQYRFA